MSHAADLPDPEYLPRRTVAERVARGASLREEVPIERHAEWEAPSGRADPIAILERQGRDRDPTLLPIRYGRMATSAFAFYRGGAAIMAADLSGTPVSGLRAQLCGDAHLLNFGLFDTPERSLVFGLNDFDETLPGPTEWDVKRLVASIEIAGRDLSFSTQERRAATTACARCYRDAMHDFAAQRNIEVWYARMSAEQLQERLEATGDRATAKEAKKRVRQALQRDHLRAFDRLIEHEDAKLRFVDRPPLLTPAEDLLDAHGREIYVETLRTQLREYRESLPPDRRSLIESYRFVDLARKVVGVGSVGTRAWVVLLMGRDVGDPLILQLKEAQRSVLAPYAGDVEHGSQGRRVVEGQRLMQATSDHLLGWTHQAGFDGHPRDFYVRQLWDGKASIDVTRLTPAGLRVYAESCGWTLARGHARSGDRIAMAAYAGEDSSYEEAMAAFASAYADTNQQDHALLLDAIASGRLEALEGV
ncbi:MAG: DUF2252 domain-containing protein [Aquihabitans sp.]